jgi:hypothetical protein
MISRIQDYVIEKSGAFGEQVARFRKESVATAREAALGSADRIKGFKAPVRVVARSGIKLGNVSQTALQGLIELQSDMLSEALADVALRLERASRADGVVDLIRDQIEMLPATRGRLVDDAQRAARILRDAGREARSVATQVFQRVVDRADSETRVVRTTARKARAGTRKPRAAARKTVRRRARKSAAA